jgi:hypothetical protein
MTLPAAEAAVVDRCYHAARVILEYGSGGSTVHASRMMDKLIFSVESDPVWAMDLQQRIDKASLPSPALIYPVNIGPTGLWGRPFNDSHWQKFHCYPAAIWAEPWFRHPDVILIDGRLRAACFALAFLRITRPVTVLFDDYTGRPSYHVVEQLAAPVRVTGRMAEFRIVPGRRENWMHNLLLDLCTRMSYVGDSDYR